MDSGPYPSNTSPQSKSYLLCPISPTSPVSPSAEPVGDVFPFKLWQASNQGNTSPSFSFPIRCCLLPVCATSRARLQTPPLSSLDASASCFRSLSTTLHGNVVFTEKCVTKAMAALASRDGVGTPLWSGLLDAAAFPTVRL